VSLLIAGGATASAASAAPRAATLRATPGRPAARSSKLAECSSAQLAFSATTNAKKYAPGKTVVITASAEDISKTPCALVVGLDKGYAPTITVTNSKDEIVWSRCDVKDQPGACFEILVLHPLTPGESFTEKAYWDQGHSANGKPPLRVAPGIYTLTTVFWEGQASAAFSLTKAPAS
jgi:hypothetical protein